jgi:hypothetical protein
MRSRVAILTVLGYVAALAVAYVTGKASWGHIVHVGHMVSEPEAAWLPVAIDGMVLAGVVMSGVDRIRGYRSRWWAVTGIVLGSALTLTFNIVSAAERGTFAMIVSMMYAVTFLVTIETMTHPSQRALARLMTVPAPVAEVEPTVPEHVDPLPLVEPIIVGTIDEPAEPVIDEPESPAEPVVQPRKIRRRALPSYPGTYGEVPAFSDAVPAMVE